MNIVINGKNLQKRIINGQEVEKVIRNGVQIRPSSTPPTPTEDYLCFTAMDSGGQVAFYKQGTPYEVQLETSRDKTNWSDYTFGTEINLSNIGDKVYFRNKSETVTGFSKDSDNYYSCRPIKSGASGDINYLLCKNSTTVLSSALHEYCFYRLFTNSPLLTAPKLPATTLADYCYWQMFNDCSLLTIAPELPATTLARGCYAGMFRYCSSLTAAPELPATTGADTCYSSMFYGCTSLTTLPKLPATTLIGQCYYQMFRGCSNIKISDTQTGEYQTPYRIPTLGTGTQTESASLRYMFTDTGGTFTGTPTINTTYYTSNTVI